MLVEVYASELLMELVGCGKEHHQNPCCSFLNTFPSLKNLKFLASSLVSWLKPDVGSTSFPSSKISLWWFLILGADLPLPNPPDLLL